jgi:hypothetical protein
MNKLPAMVFQVYPETFTGDVPSIPGFFGIDVAILREIVR